MIVRTELSNLNKLIVHFFDTRQRNEPKKTCIGGGIPLCTPSGCAYSVRMGLTFLGRLLRYSRNVWRVRLRNDAYRSLHYSSAARAASMRLHYSLFITPLGQGPHKENGSVRAEQNR